MTKHATWTTNSLCFNHYYFAYFSLLFVEVYIYVVVTSITTIIAVIGLLFLGYIYVGLCHGWI